MPTGIYKRTQWHRERLKGHVPWNKGKTGVYSKEMLERMVVSRRGKPHPQTEETRKNIIRGIKKHYDRVGRETSVYKLIRNGEDFKKWRKQVFERDEYTCLVCGEVGGKLNAHHIKSFTKFPMLRFEVNNGITLCLSCHFLTHNFGGKSRGTKC